MTEDHRLIERPRRAIVSLVTTPRPPRHRAFVLVLASAAVALIGVVDATTGRDLSLAVFYLLPVATATILVSTQAGYALAGLSALAWVLADNIIYNERNLLISIWNGILRDLTISIVVFLLGALRTALIEAAASRQRTEDFLTTAAHQLRTPVAGVMASAEALAVETDPQRRSRLTGNLVRSTERVGRLLTALLELSRLDSSPSVAPRGSIDLAAMCRAEAESARVRFPHLTFEFTGPDELLLRLDPSAVGEAIANLTENAARHAVSRVSVVVQVDTDHASVDVMDDGAGVPPGMEEHIFDRFVVVDGLGGSGLGLPIARGLIESQHGTLDYDSKRGFRITLPGSERLSPHDGQADEQRALDEAGGALASHSARRPPARELD